MRKKSSHFLFFQIIIFVCHGLTWDLESETWGVVESFFVESLRALSVGLGLERCKMGNVKA
jgi:hypothetical protein